VAGSGQQPIVGYFMMLLRLGIVSKSGEQFETIPEKAGLKGEGGKVSNNIDMMHFGHVCYFS
jgi:hypothetical protein